MSSIGDTPESEQIARIVRNEYSKLMARLDWPHLQVVATLEGLSDTARPASMRVPESMTSITDIRYDITKAGDVDSTITSITFIENPGDFLDRVYSRNTSDSVSITAYDTAEGIPVWTYTDRPPEFCTTFDDNIIIFDAFDSAEDTTLQSSKSSCRGLRGNAWSETDTFVPLMPINMFSMFISKCKVAANEQLRQVALRTEAQDHQIGLTHLARQQRIRQEIRKPNYGRQRSTFGRGRHHHSRGTH